jgi:hypothetical protein
MAQQTKPSCTGSSPRVRRLVGDDPDTDLAASSCCMTNLAARGHEWPAGIARIERGVGLDHVINQAPGACAQ